MTTTTVDQLSLSNYAEAIEAIEAETGLDRGDYAETADGLAELLRDAASDMNDHLRDWMEDAAFDLDAIARLGDNGPRTAALLRRVNGTLHDVQVELS